jgi:hypothetical protein
VSNTLAVRRHDDRILASVSGRRLSPGGWGLPGRDTTSGRHFYP